MIDLLGNLPAVLGGIAALLALFWGKGKLDRRKGRQEGREEVINEVQEADHERADEIRRRLDGVDDGSLQRHSSRGYRD